jgi:hypothetical protein
MGLWQDGKRTKWLEGEEDEEIAPEGWLDYQAPYLPETLKKINMK